MLVIGRITKDAVVKTTNSGKEVVEFSVALNDFYKTKSGELKKFTTFLNCSYWFNSKIAQRLTKAALVELTGRIDVNPYLGKDGQPKASLNFYVNSIRIHHAASGISVNSSGSLQPGGAPVAVTEMEENLPF